MENFYNYITDPWTLVTFVVFVFWLWATWNKSNWQIKELEKRVERIEELDLDARLTQMQIDLDWIKKTLDELKRK